MMGMNPTLGDVYGPGHAYCGYAHPHARRWLPQDVGAIEAMSGSQLTVAGRAPVLCAARAAVPEGLALLQDAGLPVAENLLTFRDDDEYERMLRELCDRGVRIIVQHRHPADILPPASCWVDPNLLSRLNDKANLGEFVPAAWLPRRDVFDRAAFEWRPKWARFPFVLKAATAQSSGGGADVVICRNPDDYMRARCALADSERIVAEEWLDYERAYCLNYVIDGDGGVRLLGTAEMVSDHEGGYRGNWLGDGVSPDPATISSGLEVMRRGAAAGFRGLAGLDVAEIAKGTHYIFDLNFRLCGSSVPLVVFPGIRSATGATVARFRGWTFRGNYRELLCSARRAWSDGYFVPLASHDPGDRAEAGCVRRINGLLLGASRSDVEAAEKRLAAEGWT